MKTVLAPIDFSRVTRQVIAEAVTLARAIDGRLVLLHVVQPAPIIASEFAVPETGPESARAADREAAQRLGRLQVELQGEGVTAHVVHLIGYPGEKIVEEAVKLNADFIVMGSHGHTAFYDLIVGSTASRVLKSSPSPVMITPSAAKKTPPTKVVREARETAGAARK